MNTKNKFCYSGRVINMFIAQWKKGVDTKTRYSDVTKCGRFVGGQRNLSNRCCELRLDIILCMTFITFVTSVTTLLQSLTCGWVISVTVLHSP